MTSKTWPRERPKGTRMGRGHFKLIAAALQAAMPHDLDDQRVWEDIVFKLTDALAQTNPSFRRETFLAACGVSDED